MSTPPGGASKWRPVRPPAISPSGRGGRSGRDGVSSRLGQIVARMAADPSMSSGSTLSHAIGASAVALAPAPRMVVFRRSFVVGGQVAPDGRVEDDARASCRAIGSQPLLQPFRSIGAFDADPRSRRECERRFDTREPLELVGPDIRQQPVTVRRGTRIDRLHIAARACRDRQRCRQGRRLALPARRDLNRRVD